jgi:hypothetical protein
MATTFRRYATAACIALLARMTAAQATVTGVVRDSIAKGALRGAIVQIVPADSLSGRSVQSDSTGAFTFRAIPAGRYHVGFIHPMLDSLGLEPIVRPVNVPNEGTVLVDLAIPSAAKLRDAMCGPRSPGKAVITGFVRDASTHEPIGGAVVAADWLELTFQKGGIVRVYPRSDAISAANGWFALCNVPSEGTMGLFAARGTDSTDVLDVSVTKDGFLRHDLYVGRGRAGTLTGTVTSATSGQRLQGATIAVGAATPIRANAQGEWTLSDLPLGTRVLEIRAVGYYPERRGVHVTAGAPEVRVGLSSLRAVLDTVRIRAARLQDIYSSGFEDRRRTGAGFYLTANDIARKGAHNTADIFNGVRGIRIGFASDTGDNLASIGENNAVPRRQLLMRSITGNLCPPAIFLNGIAVDGLDADDLDAWATPKEISAIEIYSEATTPAQFQRMFKSCGTIVIWTKR